MTRAMVWFRADLRVRDHAALAAAGESATRGIVGVFAICPGQWAEHDWGAMKVSYILRSLRELRGELAALNIPLLIVETPRFEGVAAALLKLARTHACDCLLFNREHEINERRRDEAVRAAFEKDGRRCVALTDQTVFEPGAIRTGAGDFYTVFTPFKRAFFKAAGGAGARLASRGKPKKQAAMVCAADDVPASVKGFDAAVDRADLWPAGSLAARKCLARFVGERLGAYASRRDEPGVNGTSTLSPALTAGAISVRECLAAAIEANEGRLEGGRTGAQAWIGELVWREFYKHVLAGFPRVGMGRAFKAETEAIRWSEDEAAFLAWREGRTGVPIVDAGMRQLAQTGWMHNRARMIVAMYLTKDLFINWRWGERWFMRRLVDGDLAANNGGWQWSASTGTDAAPYFRVFNPVSQSKKCDPRGAYIRRFVPELAGLGEKEIHEPWLYPLLVKGAYPPPVAMPGRARERVVAAFKAASGR